MTYNAYLISISFNMRSILFPQPVAYFVVGLAFALTCRVYGGSTVLLIWFHDVSSCLYHHRSLLPDRCATLTLPMDSIGYVPQFATPLPFRLLMPTARHDASSIS